MIKKYLELGWVVIPTYYKSKIPAIAWKEFKETKPSYAQVKGWFNGKWRNVAILTGKLSGVCVIDFDSMEACERHKHLFEINTFTVKTNRGYHKYFKYPEGVVLVNRFKVPEYRDIDFKMDGGLVTAPPSVHKSGVKYEALTDKIYLADLPLGILDLCAKRDKPQIYNLESLTDKWLGNVLSVPIKILLSDLGILQDTRGDYYCYNGHDKETASLKIYPNTNSYYCFGCGQGGNVVNLASRAMGRNYYSAGKFIESKYCIVI